MGPNRSLTVFGAVRDLSFGSRNLLVKKLKADADLNYLRVFYHVWQTELNFWWEATILSRSYCVTFTSYFYHKFTDTTITWQKDVFRLNTTVTTFLTIFTKKGMFTIWCNYVDSNVSLKYVFHEKNGSRSEKTCFLAKKVMFCHKSLLYQMIMRIYQKDIWLK